MEMLKFYQELAVVRLISIMMDQLASHVILSKTQIAINVSIQLFVLSVMLILSCWKHICANSTALRSHFAKIVETENPALTALILTFQIRLILGVSSVQPFPSVWFVILLLELVHLVLRDITLLMELVLLVRLSLPVKCVME